MPDQFSPLAEAGAAIRAELAKRAAMARQAQLDQLNELKTRADLAMSEQERQTAAENTASLVSSRKANEAKVTQDLADKAEEHRQLVALSTNPNVRPEVRELAQVRLGFGGSIPAGYAPPVQKTGSENMSQAAYEVYLIRQKPVEQRTPAEQAKVDAFEIDHPTFETKDTEQDKARNQTQANNAIQRQLDAIERTDQPIRDQLRRSGYLMDTLSRPGSVNDAVATPEFLTIMAGGFGTGLRMTEAELNKIQGAQPFVDKILAALSHWRSTGSLDTWTDENGIVQTGMKPLMLQPQAREAMRQAGLAVITRSIALRKLNTEYRERIADAKSATDARKLYAELQKKQDELFGFQISDALEHSGYTPEAANKAVQPVAPAPTPIVPSPPAPEKPKEPEKPKATHRFNPKTGKIEAISGG